MDANTNTRTSLSAYLLEQSAKEADTFTKGVLELAAKACRSYYMRGFTQCDDIVGDAISRTIEARDSFDPDAPPATEGKAAWLAQCGITHDPLAEFFGKYLRVAQRFVERRQKSEPRIRSLTDELLERVERSRAAAHARPLSGSSRREQKPARIDLEVERMLHRRTEGARASVERGVVRDAEVLAALDAVDEKKSRDVARFRQLVERLSEVDPAADWSSETLQQLEVADASFWESVERNLGHWRRELACRTGCSRRRAEIALQFPVLVHAQEIERRNTVQE